MPDPTTESAKTLFEKIAAREIPAEFVHEDDLCFAIRDIAPQAPAHILVIPKRRIARAGETTAGDEQLLGHLVVTAGKIARDLGLTDGFRLVINSGKRAGETVPHLHVHLLGGRDLAWPPG
ncbi:MAG: histidine triad nucleotide-binding protein [Puniceicoccales bacterium]|jgi:histidine triad (HIT) family protein|nr:histidine triad nucleotide-binding protein [Puniceicoccales bacterium]